MVRFAVLILIAFGLASCGSQASPLEGKWGWFSQEACTNDRDAIEFAGRAFYHRRNGEVFVTGQDVVYQEAVVGDATRVTATYVVVGENNSRTISLTFEVDGDDELLFRGSTIDGVAPQAAAQALGQRLYRCD